MSNGKGGGDDSRPYVQLIGHVGLINGFSYSGFTGCVADINLKGAPSRMIWVLTTDHHLQTLLETALATGNLVSATGQARSLPAEGPLAGMSGELFDLTGLTLYNSK